MQRTASDNEYLHKDFHAALSGGLDYLRDQYGEQAVRDYLRSFTLSFYGPLRDRLKTEGLRALEEHFRRIYEIEGGEVTFELSEDELVIRVAACPAVKHMKEKGHPVSDLFHETTRVVNEALCEGTSFAADLVAYDSETGASVQRFYRRNA
jgi:hypothetical protein